jgi:hypothetical protein
MVRPFESSVHGFVSSGAVLREFLLERGHEDPAVVCRFTNQIVGLVDAIEREFVSRNFWAESFNPIRAKQVSSLVMCGKALAAHDDINCGIAERPRNNSAVI